MKKTVVTVLIIGAVISLLLFNGCSKVKNDSDTATSTETHKTTAKYADSEYLGSWYNAYSAEDDFICTLNDDATAVFKGDTNASWEETETGITVYTVVDGEQAAMEGYFVIAGDGYVARATDANMHYLDEGGTLQLEIMLTETTCVDCVKK